MTPSAAEVNITMPAFCGCMGCYYNAGQRKCPTTKGGTQLACKAQRIIFIRRYVLVKK